MFKSLKSQAVASIVAAGFVTAVVFGGVSMASADELPDPAAVAVDPTSAPTPDPVVAPAPSQDVVTPVVAAPDPVVVAPEPVAVDPTSTPTPDPVVAPAPSQDVVAPVVDPVVSPEKVVADPIAPTTTPASAEVVASSPALLVASAPVPGDGEVVISDGGDGPNTTYATFGDSYIVSESVGAVVFGTTLKALQGPVSSAFVVVTFLDGTGKVVYFDEQPITVGNPLEISVPWTAPSTLSVSLGGGIGRGMQDTTTGGLGTLVSTQVRVLEPLPDSSGEFGNRMVTECDPAGGTGTVTFITERRQVTYVYVDGLVTPQYGDWEVVSEETQPATSEQCPVVIVPPVTPPVNPAPPVEPAPVVVPEKPAAPAEVSTWVAKPVESTGKLAETGMVLDGSKGLALAATLLLVLGGGVIALIALRRRRAN